MNIVFMINAVLLIAFSFICTTNNLQSAIIFKVIPFVLGVAQMFFAMKLVGLL